MAKGIGILLLHGFTGSRAEMEWLEDNLKAKGFTTALPLLCGHETEPEDLLRCRYQDWLAEATQAYEALEAHCDKVFLVGLSMGGALALYLAAERRIAGLVTLAAPVKLPFRLELGARLLSRFIPWQHKEAGPDIRDPQMKTKLRSYQKYPTRAAVQLFALLHQVRKKLSRVTAPILIMHSRQDHAVPAKNAERICRSIRSVNKELIFLNDSYHLIACDVEKEVVLEHILNFVSGNR